MLKCLVIDDEPLALNVLEKFIQQVPYLQLEGSCTNAFKAMEILQYSPIDLLFLDIQMPKLIGTSFARTLQHPPKIIFTTAYKEYAVDAFEVDAVDYLLKPFSFERFLKAVNKLNYKNSNEVNEKYNPPDNELQEGFLYFRYDRKMVKVFLHEIIYIESLKDYIKIYRHNKQPLIVRHSIRTLEEILPRKMFARVHRSFIVSLACITSFTNHDIEIGNVEIPVGRQFKNEIERFNIFRKTR